MWNWLNESKKEMENGNEWGGEGGVGGWRERERKGNIKEEKTKH